MKKEDIYSSLFVQSKPGNERLKHATQSRLRHGGWRRCNIWRNNEIARCVELAVLRRVDDRERTYAKTPWSFQQSTQLCYVSIWLCINQTQWKQQHTKAIYSPFPQLLLIITMCHFFKPPFGTFSHPQDKSFNNFLISLSLHQMPYPYQFPLFSIDNSQHIHLF